MAPLPHFASPLASAACAGIALIVVLSLGYFSWQIALAAVVIGWLASYPAAWLWSKSIKDDDPR